MASEDELARAVAALEKKAQLAERLAEMKAIQSEYRDAEEAVSRAAAAVRERLARLTPLLARASARVGEATRAGKLAQDMVGHLAAATAAMGAANMKALKGPTASTLVEAYLVQRIAVAHSRRRWSGRTGARSVGSWRLSETARWKTTLGGKR